MPSLGERQDQDVFSVLETKERDLILAAELGKSLLERNEELSKQSEKIAEEFSQKLEILEQEKYQLKRALEVAEEEYQQRVSDLQADISQLRESLEQSTCQHRYFERQSGHLVADLTDQNQRLTSQLRDVGEQEKELRGQIERMKDQFQVRKTSIQEHFGYVESLRDEISSVTKQKSDLEKQIRDMVQEKKSLVKSLDNSSSQIQQLERRQRDQEMLVRTSQQNLQEIRAGNHNLLERLESMSRSRSSSPTGGPVGARLSLLSELELSSASDGEKSIYSRLHSFDVIQEMEEEDEADDDFELEEMEQSSDEEDMESALKDLRDEVLSTYHQLRNMSALIRQRERKFRSVSGDSLETSSSSSVEIQKMKVGQLEQAVSELKCLLLELLRKQSRSPSACGTCGRSLEEKLALERELHQTLELIERGKIGLKQAELEAKKKEEQIQGVKSKLALVEARLSAADEERLILRTDLAETKMSQENRIKSAWVTRDAAVDRKNLAEVELAKGRIESMQVNSQLLEAVQQKVKLSQQLEDWEVDLQLLLQDQVKDKLDTDSGIEKDSRERKASRPNSRILSFFSHS